MTTIRLPNGVSAEGVGEEPNRFIFSGFFPWQARAWYAFGPSRQHQIPNFLHSNIVWKIFYFFSSFAQVFSGFEPGLFNFQRPPLHGRPVLAVASAITTSIAQSGALSRVEQGVRAFLAGCPHRIACLSKVSRMCLKFQIVVLGNDPEYSAKGLLRTVGGLINNESVRTILCRLIRQKLLRTGQ